MTASICTTELWDALKSFMLTSLKIKVAPYPIIVSVDTFKKGRREKEKRKGMGVRFWQKRKKKCKRPSLNLSFERGIRKYSVYRVMHVEPKVILMLRLSNHKESDSTALAEL